MRHWMNKTGMDYYILRMEKTDEAIGIAKVSTDISYPIAIKHMHEDWVNTHPITQVEYESYEVFGFPVFAHHISNSDHSLTYTTIIFDPKHLMVLDDYVVYIESLKISV